MVEAKALEKVKDVRKKALDAKPGLPSRLRKDALPVAASAATVLGAAYITRKGPDLARSLTGKLKDKAGGEAEELGREGARGAREGLGGGLGRMAGAAAPQERPYRLEDHRRHVAFRGRQLPPAGLPADPGDGHD